MIYLACTVDIDNDGVSVANERTLLAWESLALVPALKEQFDAFGLRATWFIRADEQLTEVYGSAAHLLREYAALWGQLASTGDELAWHPHLYRRAGQSYYAETDPQRAAESLARSWKDLAAYEFFSVRVGEALGANQIFACLARLGLRADSTALPGRKREDAERRFDWSVTPNAPYIPSAKDYRAPAHMGEELPLVEVPMTTADFQSRAESRGFLRYVNLAYHHECFRRGLQGWLDGVSGDAFLTTIVHPDELRPGRSEHPLYAFALPDVEKNLRYLIAAIAHAGHSLCPVRVRDVAMLLRGREGAAI